MRQTTTVQTSITSCDRLIQLPSPPKASHSLPPDEPPLCTAISPESADLHTRKGRTVAAHHQEVRSGLLCPRIALFHIRCWSEACLPPRHSAESCAWLPLEANLLK